MKNTLLLLSLLLSIATESLAFCGFYVARADAKLFNKTSQVILVRDGDRSTITMSSDFQGDVRDFAMIIPVPVLLQREDIRIINRRVFDQLDAYSGPRLAEYYDNNPCYRTPDISEKAIASEIRMESDQVVSGKSMQRYNTVKVLAKYTIGEYDIVMLSSEESKGLEEWLRDNGYKLPAQAADVLEPYIRSKHTFFVVKVNLEEQFKSSLELLNPIQITFRSPKFMLPIRLGMANAERSQDMVVYAFSREGRIESTNYRTSEMPSDIDIPVFVKDNFGTFYTDLYKRNLRKEGEGTLFVEYAWDLSGTMAVKCDPCPAPPPLFAEMKEAGVNWITGNSNGYQGSVFFTRLHITYNRESFPQDLAFQVTPNRTNFQCRYIIRHPAVQGDCPEWKAYYREKVSQRERELQNLARLTGRDISRHERYPTEFASLPAEPEIITPIPEPIKIRKSYGQQKPLNTDSGLARIEQQTDSFVVQQNDFNIDRAENETNDSEPKKSIPTGIWIAGIVTALALLMRKNPG